MIPTPIASGSKLPGINPVGATGSAASGPRQDSTVDPNNLANKEVFLQLLIAQIKNQDPSKPGDSIQYLTQLSQFTGVEQLVDIKNQLKTMNEKIAALDAAAQG
jgi:flagellar basal-body rod modification protein FlgD